MRFYTTEQIGASQALTNEGFLLCSGVRIARVGELYYAPEETGLEAGPDGIVRIMRLPEEVFKPEAMASFAGKPITVDHPDEDVHPGNWRDLSFGVVLNPRQGAPPDEGYLVADLLIQDAQTIKDVRAGLREVSCGYEATYVQDRPGYGHQTGIVGNHVALVEKGRCGPRCSIGDKSMAAKPALLNTTTLAGKKRQGFLDRIRARIKDNDLAGAEAAMAEMEEDPDLAGTAEGATVVINLNAGGESKDAVVKDVPGSGNGAPPDAGADDPMAKVLAALQGISDRLTAVEAKVNGTETTDEDLAKEEDKPKEGEEDKTKTGDSAGLATDFQATIASAEILCPGIKLPTFDSKVPRKATNDTLCKFRRTALDGAWATEAGRAAISLVTGGSEPDTKKMTCDAVGVIFHAAANVARAHNNTSGGPGVRDRDHSTVKVPTIAEINKSNKAFWATR